MPGTVIPPPTTPETYPLGPWRKEMIYVVDGAGDPDDTLGVSEHSFLDFFTDGPSDSTLFAWMIPPGVGGDAYTIETVGDSVSGVELELSGTAITIHFEDGVTMDQDVIDAFIAHPVLSELVVIRRGSDVPAWTVADYEFGPENFHGGADGECQVFLMKPPASDETRTNTNYTQPTQWCQIGGVGSVSEMDVCHVTRPEGGPGLPEDSGLYILWLTGSHVNLPGDYAIRLPEGLAPENPAVRVHHVFNVEPALDAATVASEVWDAVGADHGTAGTFGKFVNDLVARLTSARAGYLDNLNVGGLVSEATRDTIMTTAIRTGRTVVGLFRRLDALFFGVVTGLKGSHVVARNADDDVEFESDQNRAAGSRNNPDATGSES